MPDPTHKGTALLEPPFPATNPVAARSLEITSFGSTSEMRNTVEAVADAVKRNTDLEWLRINGQMFERTNGILHAVRGDQDTYQRVADVIVTVPTHRPEVWGNAPLSPWRVEGASGYVIHDARIDGALARNLSLKLVRAIQPLLLTVTGIRLQGNPDPKIEFRRAPYGEVAKDPAQTLENDLRSLGLWPDATNSELAPDNPTNSRAEALDAKLEEMLSARQNDAGNSSPDRFARQVIDDFNTQLEARLEISDRVNLIARLERSDIPRLDRTLIVEIAEETPALMTRMVDLYYTDLVQGASVDDVLRRVVREMPMRHLPRRSARIAHALSWP